MLQSLQHMARLLTSIFFQNTVVILVSEIAAKIMWVALRHKHTHTNNVIVLLKKYLEFFAYLDIGVYVLTRDFFDM